ncbi:MAG: hypothetical protein L3J78_04260 [Thermoplasmata archaeon]|nr:hypothetical protein [Thermoplasmata archaeon]
MVSLDWKTLRSVGRMAALSGVLGLASGYATFYGVFPVAGVPATSEASIPFLLTVMLFTSILVGAASETIAESFFEAFFGLFVSIAVATVMALSPALVGVAFVSPDSVPAFIIQYGFVLFVLGFFIDLVGGIVGLLLREKYFFRGPRGTAASAERK